MSALPFAPLTATEIVARAEETDRDIASHMRLYATGGVSLTPGDDYFLDRARSLAVESEELWNAARARYTGGAR